MIVVIGLFAVLLIVVVGLSAALVLASCALQLPFGLGTFGHCESSVTLIAPVPVEASDRFVQLAAEIAALERQLASLQCVAVPPAPVVQAAPDPAPPVADPAPETPPTTAPALEPSAEPDTELRQPEPPTDDLTQEDFGRGDIAVLKGCWELDSAYRTRNEQTGSIVVYDRWSFCFDGAGQGVERMRSTSGETCVGPVTGQFTEGRLSIIEPANLTCTGGNEIFRRELDCSLDEQGRANCAVRQPQVDSTSTARLRRASGDN